MTRAVRKQTVPMTPERRMAEIERRLRQTNAALARIIRHEGGGSYVAPCERTEVEAWHGELRLVASNRKLLREIGGRRRPLSERNYPPLLALMEGPHADLLPGQPTEAGGRYAEA